MFKSLPSVLLTNFEIKNLKVYINSDKISELEKHNKIRESLEMKELTIDVEKEIVNLYSEIINGKYSDEVTEAFLLSLNHIYFKKSENLINLIFELYNLFENPRFILDFQNNYYTDVIMIIEKKIGEMFSTTIDARKFTCVIILAYLEGMMSEKKVLSFKLLDRLLTELNSQGYNEFDDLGYTFDKNKVNEIVNYYLEKGDSALRARFQNNGIFGKRRSNLFELSEQIKSSFPKNFK